MWEQVRGEGIDSSEKQFQVSSFEFQKRWRRTRFAIREVKSNYPELGMAKEKGRLDGGLVCTLHIHYDELTLADRTIWRSLYFLCLEYFRFDL
jgi:hypothetical protein